MRRILFGAIAGAAASMAMTATMRRLYRLLPPEDAYPLPPREITQRLADAAGIAAGERALQTATVSAHFGYGVAAGALFPLLTARRTPLAGMGYGLVVWLASYLGWIPLARVLTPAQRHPLGRTLLMLTAHAVWGGLLATGVREVEEAASDPFRGRRTPDAEEQS
jgi:hypothetical protein